MEGDLEKKLSETMAKFRKIKDFQKPSNDLTRAEFFMLKSIEKTINGNKDKLVTITEIIEKLQIAKPTASQMLNSLEEKSLIERIRTNEDRRVVYVKLTEKGKEVLEKAHKEFSKLTKNLITKLGKKDTEELIRILEKLYIIAKDSKQ
ncbi:MAG: MarR family transcriptional regulator [Oscillospiraceae bacterium]|nr:MarR family transcriptional regulator [Oscillospiraceae bacterium]